MKNIFYRKNRSLGVSQLLFFSGRLSRLHYIPVSLILFLILGTLMTSHGLIGNHLGVRSEWLNRLTSDGWRNLTFFSTFVVWILFSTTAARLHDLNETGAYTLLHCIPVLNLGIIIYCIFFKSYKFDNKYGPGIKLPRSMPPLVSPLGENISETGESFKVINGKIIHTEKQKPKENERTFKIGSKGEIIHGMNPIKESKDSPDLSKKLKDISDPLLKNRKEYMKEIEEFFKTSVGKFIAIIIAIIILHNLFSPYKECVRNLTKDNTNAPYPLSKESIVYECHKVTSW